MNGPAGYSASYGFAGTETPSHQSGHNPMRRLMLLSARSIILALLYYFLVAVSMKLHLSTSSLALVWPSNALLVAALVLSPKRHWWVYLLAVVPAHVAALSPYHVGFWWLAYQIAVNS